MAIEPVVVDTGPIVAYLSRRDALHDRATDQFKRLRAPVYTTWPVLTEAAWLLREYENPERRLHDFVQTGAVAVLNLPEDALGWIADLTDQYKDLRPQLADASLLYIAQQLKTDTVFTFDRRDFSVYRLTGNEPVKIVP